MKKVAIEDVDLAVTNLSSYIAILMITAMSITLSISMFESSCFLVGCL